MPTLGVRRTGTPHTATLLKASRPDGLISFRLDLFHLCSGIQLLPVIRHAKMTYSMVILPDVCTQLHKGYTCRCHCSACFGTRVLTVLLNFVTMITSAA